MNLVIAGHVDHGKSTVIGRMLADTSSLPQGKLERLKKFCKDNSRPFEYAFLLDALKDEQSQGITIDSARIFFQTVKRKYIIIDAPGHIEFLKNMISGASNAEAALLVIDAKEGVQENSKRHAYMLSMLGIKQIAVVVNKMDLIDYDQNVYNTIVDEFKAFLSDIQITSSAFIPVSGMEGDNIAALSDKMPWHTTYTVVDILDNFIESAPETSLPLRMPVQDVYRFSRYGDQRRITAGTISTGTLQKGDEVVFLPSGKKSTVATIEDLNGEMQNASAGESTGFTLTQQIYIQRGEMLAKANEKAPYTSKRFKASVFWLGREPMKMKKSYYLKIGTAKVELFLEKIEKLIDASTLASQEDKNHIGRHDVAECILKTQKPIPFDTAETLPVTSRFVIVDNFEIQGGGIITAPLEDKYDLIRKTVLQRNYKWTKGEVSKIERAERYAQKPTLLLVTGKEDVGKKPLAKAIEAELFSKGRTVYFMGIANVLYGIDADINTVDKKNPEHVRRLAEVANLMLDAGIILIVTAIELTQDDLEIIKTTINYDDINVIWAGDNITTDISIDLQIDAPREEMHEMSPKAINFLEEKGIIQKFD